MSERLFNGDVYVFLPIKRNIMGKKLKADAECPHFNCGNSSTANIEIKKGNLSNIEKYIAIFTECKHDAYISHGEILCGRATHDLKWADDILSQMRQEFDDYLSGKDQCSVFEILFCGETAGFAVLEIDTLFRTAQIHDIMIKKELQGKGAGTAAMHEIEEYLKKENIGMILLESGIQNKAAHDFFEKNGFTQISVEFAKRLNVLHAKTEDEKMHDFFIEAMTKTFNKYAEYYETHTILIGEENDPEYFTVDNVRLEKDTDIDNLMRNVGTQPRFSGIDMGMIWNKGKTYQDPYFDRASRRFPEDYRGIIMSASPKDIELSKKQRIPVEIYPAGENHLDDICYAYNAGMNDKNSGYNTDINYNRVMRKIVTLTDPCFKTEVLLARSKENGKIAGILIGVYNESMAYLNDVSVLPEFQNRGLASLFTKQFADDMKTAGVKEIILDTRKDTGEQKNGFAKTNQRMYARFGFVDRIETFQTLIKENIGRKIGR